MPALADQKIGDSYLGLQYAQTSYEDDNGVEAEPSAAVGRLGHFVTDNFAIEGRAGFGISEDEASYYGSNTNVNVEIDSLLGVYGVGHLPISETVSAYALAGFTSGEATASNAAGSVSGDDSGFSYGIGGELSFTPRVSATLEYMSYLDKSDYQISAISAGLNFSI